MSLYQKYRPETFDEIFGNESTVQSLVSLMEDEKRPHSYLFTGPSGCGKTTLARIIKEELECSDGDFYEVDAADFRGVDYIRDLRKQIQYAPMAGEVRVFLLDECHQLTKDAQNALLKALEDTPSHVYFILATTEPDKLLKTIKTRCSTFEVSLLRDDEMRKLIYWVVEEEEKKISEAVGEAIKENSQGSPRQALTILEKVLSVKTESEQLEIALHSEREKKKAIDLCRLLIKPKVKWNEVNCILRTIEEEPETVRRIILGYFTQVLLKKDNKIAYIVMSCFLDNFYDSGKAGLICACYDAVTGK